ncbi:alpha/beta hydrolase [Vibrio tubiashii]|uniref:alpha/beta fold hydrolase n=1 Tax=Vibrio tubiashii TaxID=29498 RepID=UPI001EFEAFCC|nr:alpha/beta fold hydrolase [Vibrio tubiashii]MCG9575273.1 alpha/beta hydrolase [Vibrio tubiashii]
MNTHIVESGDFSLKVVVQGTGKPLLIIGSTDYYYRIMPESIYSNFQCIYIDHRGFAACSRAPDIGDASLDIIADDIEFVCQSLELDTVAILGHSGHGYMAAYFAIRYPTRISSLVLSNISPSLSPEMQSKQFERWESEADETRKAYFAENITKLNDDIQSQPERKFVHMCHRLGAMRWFDFGFNELPLWEGFPTHTVVLDKLWGQVFTEISGDFYQALPAIPLLIIGSDHDFSIAPLECWQSIDFGLAQVELKQISRSGHTPMLEQPEHFLEALEWFIYRREINSTRE